METTKLEIGIRNKIEKTDRFLYIIKCIWNKKVAESKRFNQIIVLFSFTEYEFDLMLYFD